MHTVRILFLGGAKRVSLAERFIAAGRRLRHDVSIFSYELTRDVPIASIGRVIVGLRWGQPEILADLTRVCAAEKIDIVLPFVDPAIAVAAALRAQADAPFIPVSPLAWCETFFDKRKTAAFCRQQRIPAPAVVRRAPCIAKPVRGSASHGIMWLTTTAAFKVFVQTNDVDAYVLQRILSGDEFTIDCYVAMDGRILASVPRQRLEVTDGEVTKTRVVGDRDLVAFARRVLTHASGLCGPVTLQVMRQKTRAIALLEVNPRFGGGVIATIEAGVDIPRMVLHDFLKRPNPRVRYWRRNLLMMRAYREHFSYARS